MNNFTELTLPATMDTSNNDLIAEFFVPLLARSVRYDRGVTEVTADGENQ
jgi:hypothetical protein